jgi:hypothetical protein
MSSISLQQDIIYGHIFSGRLGRFLGVNLLPTDHKVCSFNCVLHPNQVQIYSAERPTAREDVFCLSLRRLQSIQANLQIQYGLNVDAFYWG